MSPFHIVKQQGSGKPAQMRRLARAIAAPIHKVDEN